MHGGEACPLPSGRLTPCIIRRIDRCFYNFAFGMLDQVFPSSPLPCYPIEPFPSSTASCFLEGKPERHPKSLIVGHSRERDLQLARHEAGELSILISVDIDMQAALS